MPRILSLFRGPAVLICAHESRSFNALIFRVPHGGCTGFCWQHRPNTTAALYVEVARSISAYLCFGVLCVAGIVWRFRFVLANLRLAPLYDGPCVSRSCRLYMGLRLCSLIPLSNVINHHYCDFCFRLFQ